MYIQKVLLNDKPLSTLFIKYANIVAGSTLTFVMGPKPKK